MKNLFRTAAVLLTAAWMALSVCAEPALPEDPVVPPRIKNGVPVYVTSTMASDGTDVTPMYDADNATTTVFENAADGVSLFMTAGAKFRLAGFVLDGCDDEYTVTLAGSHDGQNWVDVSIKSTNRDGYMVYNTQALGINYRYYRLHFTTEEGALELGTVIFYARQDYCIAGAHTLSLMY